MKKLILFHIFFGSLQAFSAVYLKVIYIADHKVECGTKTCLLSREAPTSAYQIFDNEIEGFTYLEGYEYCLLVSIQPPPVLNPLIPSESSKEKYMLSEIISKTRTVSIVETKKTTVNIPDSSRWLLYKLRLKDGSTKTFSIQKAYLQFDVKNNTVSGNTECNSFNAAFSTDTTFLKFENVVTTKMACGKHSIEPLFLDMMSKVTAYKINSKLLYLLKGKTLLGLFTRKK